MQSVTALGDGDAEGTRAVLRIVWRTALPYRIAFDVEATRIEPMQLIEGGARGELDGEDLWTFWEDGQQCSMRYG